MSGPDRTQMMAWAKLHGEARRAVREPTEKKAAAVVAWAVVSPSFGDEEGFEVFRHCRREGEYFCVHTRWDREADLRRWVADRKREATPAPFPPTIRVRQFGLRPKLTAKFLSELQGCRVPAMASSEVSGFDSVTTELFLGDFRLGFHRSYFRWWSSHPPEWDGLVRVAGRLIRFLRKSGRKSRLAEADATDEEVQMSLGVYPEFESPLDGIRFDVTGEALAGSFEALDAAAVSAGLVPLAGLADALGQRRFRLDEGGAIWLLGGEGG